ncbi:MAG: beta-lactamase family protein [Cytophagaceae bacterium]|nr:beta-lactamase family protein [Cytophagaceae bacterium]
MQRQFLLVYLLIVTQVSQAQTVDSVDSFIRQEMMKQNIQGLSMAVVRDGKVIKAQGYGLANVEWQQPATAETVYKIASVSKQFFATGILLLAEAGKLNLSDPVHRFFPDAPESWRGITIHHLLSHSSGLIRECPGFDPQKLKPDSVLIKSAYPAPLLFKPSEKWAYCNVGYFMLAEIISRVSGQPWSEYIGNTLFAPVQMSTTRTTTTSELISQRAGGYSRVGSTLKNAPEYLAIRPSGAFISSVLDLAKWEIALQKSGVLTQKSKSLLWTPVIETGSKMPDETPISYGYGWNIATQNNHTLVSHGGSLPGFSAQYIRFPDDNVAIILLSNADGVRWADLIEKLGKVYLKK